MKTLTRCARCTVRLMLLAHLLYAPILCLRFCELRAMLAGGDSLADGARLAAPPMPANMPLWKGAVAVLIVLGIAFPLAGGARLAVVLLDFLVISRIAPLKRLVS